MELCVEQLIRLVKEIKRIKLCIYVCKLDCIKGQVQGLGCFLTRFPLKLAENDDVGETVI